MNPCTDRIETRRLTRRARILAVCAALTLIFNGATAFADSAGIAGPGDNATPDSGTATTDSGHDLGTATIKMSPDSGQDSDGDQAPVRTYPARDRQSPHPERDATHEARGASPPPSDKDKKSAKDMAANPKKAASGSPQDAESLSSAKSDLTDAVTAARQSAHELETIAQTGNEGRVRIDIASAAGVVASAVRRAASAAEDAGRAANLAQVESRAAEAKKAADKAENAVSSETGGANGGDLTKDSKNALQAMREAAANAREASRAAQVLASAKARQARVAASADKGK